MKCLHCFKEIHIEDWDETSVFFDPKSSGRGVEVLVGQCPACGGLIIRIRQGKVGGGEYPHIAIVESDEVVYPMLTTRFVEPEVPEIYRKDYIEASRVLSISPKASAALSRRLLQSILRQEFKIKRKRLVEEIDEFISLPGIPSHLAEAVDAIRNVGNFAAHPLKDTSTGEIVDVEPGEAEWLLDVLEALFDFAFVQPKRLAERKRRLNEKLAKLGKPPMKG